VKRQSFESKRKDLAPKAEQDKIVKIKRSGKQKEAAPAKEEYLLFQLFIYSLKMIVGLVPLNLLLPKEKLQTELCEPLRLSRKNQRLLQLRVIKRKPLKQLQRNEQRRLDSIIKVFFTIFD
jgi:hypothetical protein